MVVLASASPRRAQLLQQIGIQFIKQAADIDESAMPDESAEELVERLSREKAAAVANLRKDDSLVLGSDTIGLINKQVLVKPEDFKDFQKMMKIMSGDTHSVLTAIAIAKYCGADKKVQIISKLVESKVTFKVLSDEEIETYWQTGEPQDKAGGYAIQGYAGQFVTKIEGSYSSIVGLPLYETSELLKQMSQNQQNGFAQ
jgi:septum formation protein